MNAASQESNTSNDNVIDEVEDIRECLEHAVETMGRICTKHGDQQNYLRTEDEKLLVRAITKKIKFLSIVDLPVNHRDTLKGEK